MLKSIRQASGLGDSPETFYTNDVESINRVMKRKTTQSGQTSVDLLGKL